MTMVLGPKRPLLICVVVGVASDPLSVCFDALVEQSMSVADLY